MLPLHITCVYHIYYTVVCIILQTYTDNVNVPYDTTQLPLHDAFVQQLLSMLAEIFMKQGDINIKATYYVGNAKRTRTFDSLVDWFCFFFHWNFQTKKWSDTIAYGMLASKWQHYFLHIVMFTDAVYMMDNEMNILIHLACSKYPILPDVIPKLIDHCNESVKKVQKMIVITLTCCIQS